MIDTIIDTRDVNVIFSVCDNAVYSLLWRVTMLPVYTKSTKLMMSLKCDQQVSYLWMTEIVALVVNGQTSCTFLWGKVTGNIWFIYFVQFLHRNLHLSAKFGQVKAKTKAVNFCAPIFTKSVYFTDFKTPSLWICVWRQRASVDKSFM